MAKKIDPSIYLEEGEQLDEEEEAPKVKAKTKMVEVPVEEEEVQQPVAKRPVRKEITLTQVPTQTGEAIKFEDGTVGTLSQLIVDMANDIKAIKRGVVGE